MCYFIISSDFEVSCKHLAFFELLAHACVQNEENHLI